MRERSDLWKELAADPSSRLETVAEIGGVACASISAPIINRNLMTEALSVGNCASATLQFSILAREMVIPQSAEIVIRKRLSDGTRFSEWLPAGTFYVSQRKDDKVTNRLITLSCYDAMRKASAACPLYEGDEDTWPKSMRTVISEIAGYVGVEVDGRTWMYIRDGPDYVVPRPEGLRMRKVLGYIAAVHGGNWYITQDNRLRFVPLLSGSDALSGADRLNITATLGKVKTGAAVTVTGVSIGNGRETFTAGSRSGYVLTIAKNPYASQQIADDLAAQFDGLIYAPYTIEKGVYDPAAELGDYVVSRNDVRSVLYSETACLNLAFRGDISAPFPSEITDEYPYRSRTDELDDELRELVTIIADKASIEDLTAVRAQIDNLSVSDIKTGIIHSNDYQYEPFPLLYPSAAIYPSATTFPSNGEFVLRGFAIDFASGTIYGAFYSEQILALQEITSEQARQFLAHIQDYSNPHRITAAQVGALPVGTFIPSKTSDLINDSTFQTAENVDDKIDAKISGVYRASGSATLATLPALTYTNLGRVYDMTLDFTTTSDFVEGAGKTFPAGTNVAVVSVGNTYKYDVLSGFVDLSAINGAIAALQTEIARLKNSLTYPKS